MTKPKTTPGRQPTRMGQESPALDPRIDLTKPIYQQALALEEAGKAAAE